MGRHWVGRGCLETSRYGGIENKGVTSYADQQQRIGKDKKQVVHNQYGFHNSTSIVTYSSNYESDIKKYWILEENLSKHVHVFTGIIELYMINLLFQSDISCVTFIFNYTANCKLYIN